MKKLLLLSFALVLGISVFAQKKLTPVSAESKVHFVIKNIGIGTGGDISDLKGSIVLNTNTPEKSSADVTVAVSTIDTDNDKRDKHLKNEDYFDAEKWPTIHLKSTSIKKSKKKGEYIFNGELTIKDVTGKISFPFTVLPSNGGYLFAGNFNINRLTYHVGGESVTLSNDVAISLNIFAK